MRIRTIDLETTGLEPPAGICEVAYCDLISKSIDCSDKETEWLLTEGARSFVNPETTIPPEASAVHHIVSEDVTAAPAFIQLLPELLSIESGDTLILCAHNCKFERQWITDELTGGLPWICTYKSALHAWPTAPNHQNQTLRYWLKPSGLNRESASPAHRAYPDAYVTAFILKELLKIASVEQLISWSSEPALLSKCHFGKHYGRLWSEIENTYLEWILTKDFDEDVVFTARHYLGARNAAGVHG